MENENKQEIVIGPNADAEKTDGATQPQENPGDGLLPHQRQGYVSPNQPGTPASSKIVNPILSRLRQAVQQADTEVLSGEPVISQQHRNQSNALRKAALEALSNDLGEIYATGSVLTIKIRFDEPGDYEREEPRRKFAQPE